jgi:nicotinate-nucleotide adenylyltransferase
MARIGIFAGVFDPVHVGHITMALQAQQAAKLDRLYFLPERKPAQRGGVTHFGHRIAMLKQALRPHPKFAVLELTDVSFTVKRTLPELQKKFKGDQLVFLFGSDRVVDVPLWPYADRLLESCELVVGIRQNDQTATLRREIENWEQPPQGLQILTSYAPDVSSGKVREALYRRSSVRGLLQSVKRYSNKNWLYISIG